MRLRESLTSAVARLTAERVPSPRMNAELLLMFTLDCDRAYLFAHPERELTEEEQSRYEAALAERARGGPAQYITGHQEFWGLDFIVTPAVLIPRPETEHVVEKVLDLARAGFMSSPGAERVPQGLKPASSFAGNGTAGSRALPRCGLPNRTLPDTVDETSSARAGGQEPHRVRIADVGTGSGCIAIALAKELPDAEIHATDVSAAALEVARANAARHQFESRIRFHQTDLLEGLAGKFDLIVSNPPYVGDAEEDQVQLEVRKFEPRRAVFAGPKGTEVIARLILQAEGALLPGGWLVMEISGTIADETRRLLQAWDEVAIAPDLQAIPRVARARKRQT